MKPLREVLLIDDSDADNYLHRRILLRSGLVENVTVTRNGAEALDYLRQTSDPPDIVFLDINMPVMDGWEFLEHFEALDIARHPRVIVTMLTTSTHPDDQARAAQRASIQEFAAKPLTTAMIEALAQKHFS